MRVPRKLEIWRMGIVNYSQALKLQEKLTSYRKTHLITDTLLSLQHPPTYTLGKRRTEHTVLVSEPELKAIGAELYYTQRGGDVTFHGPNQAVLYPIISLREIGLGARKYVEKLELTMIELASLYGLKARAGQTSETGVWIGQRKIGAIGVRISSGITSHGLAFNMSPDLNYFRHIVPCGIAEKEVTSLEKEVGQPLPPEEEMRVPRKLEIWRMGIVNYSQALKLQEKLTSDRKTHLITDTLLSLQHPPTYTLGKRRTEHTVLVSEPELKAIGAELYYTQRGGDVTFHGPNQAVLYPIISLREIGLGARKYVEKLELTMIELASLYGLKARAGQTSETGVWIGQRKIGAIGVRISSGITSHGLAFNMSPDLNYFRHIVPCGIAEKEVTSLEKEVGQQLPPEEVIVEQLVSCFVRTFGYNDVVWKDASSVWLDDCC